MGYAHKQENLSFFSNVTTVLSLWGLVGAERATFSGSREPSPAPSLAPRPPKWRDRRIIPDELSDHSREIRDLVSMGVGMPQALLGSRGQVNLAVDRNCGRLERVPPSIRGAEADVLITLVQTTPFSSGTIMAWEACDVC